ncbi:MAG TPA: NlpC/P60 family protein [Microthrixaceae bacterium]|nr:NlpC/P60 family protein [Microthrixaceae bacterium]
MPRVSSSSRVVRLRPRVRRALAVGAAVFVGAAVVPVVVSAEPTQTVGDLQAQAASVSDRLESLQVRSSQLDEEYNSTRVELDRMSSQLDQQRQAVESAKGALDQQRDNARRYAIDAYVSGAPVDALMAPGDDNANLSRRVTYLTVLNGDRTDVIDDMSAAADDLAAQEAELRVGTERIATKTKTLESSKAELEQSIEEQEALQSSINGQLAEAVAAENARREAELAEQARVAAEAAQAEAARQAARQAADRAAAAARAAQESQATRATSTATSLAARPGTSRPTPAPPVQLPEFPDAGNAPPGAATAIAAARTVLGVPYRWGGASPSGFDCSGLVMWSYAKAGRSLPHSSRALYSMTRRISAEQLQPGDLVFGGSPVHHVGIYIGGGQMIHAPHSGDVVKISSMYSTSKPVSFGRL